MRVTDLKMGECAWIDPAACSRRTIENATCRIHRTGVIVERRHNGLWIRHWVDLPLDEIGDIPVISECQLPLRDTIDNVTPSQCILAYVVEGGLYADGSSVSSMAAGIKSGVERE